MKPEWVIEIKQDCQRFGIPFFFKQWGTYDDNGKRVGKKAAGRMFYAHEIGDPLPAVGDWVAVAGSTATITTILARRSAFVRKRAGNDSHDQVLAANRSMRHGRPEDIAATVSFLLSDDAEWINGQMHLVNGGR